MKLSIFQKNESNAEIANLEKLAARIEAASQSAEISVKKAEATARKAEAAAAKAEGLIKQVQAMLDQAAAFADSRASSAAVGAVREVRRPEVYSEEIEPKERTLSESGIPLVAPFIVNEK